MSRIGNKPIDVPNGTKVEIKGNEVIISGPKGTLKRTIRNEISLSIENNKIIVSRNGNDKIHKSLHGLTRTLVSNMIEGVSKGFVKSLDLVGVGYRCQLQGKKLVLQVGYSHSVEIEAPEGIEFSVEGVNKINVKGIDKQLVGDVAAKIRAVRKPEPYKGKGIKYSTEVVRRKAGKSGKK
ncbi:MAG: 50S ribosomal protein L6 [Candidatus Sericytochromatia bacterium]|nr:MAG: 50S ribosomal protein L6 [Candidatus Sericytochromatia bacterium]